MDIKSMSAPHRDINKVFYFSVVSLGFILPAVVDDDSHGGGGRESGQIQVHMFHTWRNFAHTEQLIQ